MKQNEGTSSGEILRNIRNNAIPKDTGLDIKFIRPTRTDSVFAKIGSKTNKEKTFCETRRSIYRSNQKHGEERSG